MKLQIDTKNKVLKLEEPVNLGEFHEILQKLFPFNEWKEYTLETNTTITNWGNPIVIEKYVDKNRLPWWQGPYYVGDIPGAYNTITDIPQTRGGTYNISIVD